MRKQILEVSGALDFLKNIGLSTSTANGSAHVYIICTLCCACNSTIYFPLALGFESHTSTEGEQYLHLPEPVYTSQPSFLARSLKTSNSWLTGHRDIENVNADQQLAVVSDFI